MAEGREHDGSGGHRGGPRGRGGNDRGRGGGRGGRGGGRGGRGGGRGGRDNRGGRGGGRPHGDRQDPVLQAVGQLTEVSQSSCPELPDTDVDIDDAAAAASCHSAYADCAAAAAAATRATAPAAAVPATAAPATGLDAAAGIRYPADGIRGSTDGIRGSTDGISRLWPAATVELSSTTCSLLPSAATMGIWSRSSGCLSSLDYHVDGSRASGDDGRPYTRRLAISDVSYLQNTRTLVQKISLRICSSGMHLNPRRSLRDGMLTPILQGSHLPGSSPVHPDAGSRRTPCSSRNP